MTNSTDYSLAFRASFAQECVPSSADYVLVSALEDSYSARSREGAPSLIVPLAAVPPGAVGRQAAGCELIPHSSARFVHGEKHWDAPAAALVCHDANLLDPFSIFASDVIRRTSAIPTWPTLERV